MEDSWLEHVEKYCVFYCVLIQLSFYEKFPARISYLINSISRVVNNLFKLITKFTPGFLVTTKAFIKKPFLQLQTTYRFPFISIRLVTASYECLSGLPND